MIGLVVFLALLALSGAVIFWICLVSLLLEWEYMDIFQRIRNILTAIVGLTAGITCSYIMTFCL